MLYFKHLGTFAGPCSIVGSMSDSRARCPGHTCDIFLEPDREIWDFSEGDCGLK